MKRTNWTVGEYSVRPFGKEGECFYCHTQLGEQHKEDCLIRARTVNVDFTIHMVMQVPEYWDESDINFKFNDSSWCASNILNELQQREEETGRCICLITDAKYVGEATKEDEERYGYCKVKEFES